MRTLKTAFQVIVGLVLVLLYHIPRLIFHALLLSYASVFARDYTLTANPEEHLKRAFRLLRRGRNSDLLYAALELRLALERIVDFELSLAPGASSRMVEEYDPVKKLKNLRRLEPRSASRQRITLANKETGDRVEIALYEPLDADRVTNINGRLGDLLHAKYGIPLGIPTHAWYSETRAFLGTAADYLLERYKASTPLGPYVAMGDFKIEPW